MSTESIASPSHTVGAAEPCPSCGAAMAADQRYCLECGERRHPMSSVLLGGVPSGGDRARQGAPTTTAATEMAPVPSFAQRGSALTVIAGVGVLMLAMGVGVLIGRAGGSSPTPASPQVITVGTSAGAAAPGTVESFTGDWPAGTSGYTVQLQTLPQPGTLLSAVQAAKAQAGARGAKAVGALKSEEFSSLPGGRYVIYSGVYHRKAEAERALAGLRRSFPGASVIAVSNRAAGSSTEGSSPSAGGSGAGSTPTHPAPPSVLEGLKTSKGKSYVEKSKSLPNVVETG